MLNGLRRREQQISIRVLREERLSLGVPEAIVDGEELDNEDFDHTLGDGSLSQLVTQQLYSVNTSGEAAVGVNTDTIGSLRLNPFNNPSNS